MRPTTALTAVVLLGLAGPALAGPTELPAPGSAGRVVCLADPDQDYQLFLPRTYRRGKPVPILYCFAPDGNGKRFVTLYRPLVETYGWAIAASLKARNGPSDPIKAAIKAIVRDTETRLTLHGKKRFGSGFSGGARMSSWLIYAQPHSAQGLICLGAGLAPGLRPRDDIPFCMILGDRDPNAREMEFLRGKFEKLKVPTLFRTFDGGHAIAAPEVLQEAVNWHQKLWRDTYQGKGRPQAAARRKVVERRLKLAAERCKDKPAHLWRELKQIQRGLPKWEGAEGLKKRIKELEKDKLVRLEKSGRKKLDALLTRAVAMGRAARKLAGSFRKMADKYAGTPVGEIATERVAALGG